MIPLSKRLLSVDVFRAVTMFFMIFVNDVDRVTNIPGWIKHQNPDFDALGFADVIFPAFLFIVGLSLPLAIINRLNRGDSFYKTAYYIFSRSAILIIMGLFQVNMDVYSADLPKPIWQILVTIGFFLLWLDYPRSMNKTKKYLLQVAGAVLLLLMAYLFKGGEAPEQIWFRPYWWGILGLIGWTYFVCATVFLVSKGNLSVQIIAFIVFMLVNIAWHTDASQFPVSLLIIGHGGYAALTMAGVVTSLLYSKFINNKKNTRLWIVLTLLGIVILIFGFLVRPYTGGISKVRVTPACTAICIGISILFFELMIFLIDIKGRQDWFKWIRPAGTSALTCYLIPYFFYSFYDLSGLHYPDFLSQGSGGILRSFALAFLVIWITGLLEKARIRLKV